MLPVAAIAPAVAPTVSPWHQPQHLPPTPRWKAKVGLPKMPTSQFPKTAKMCTIHGKGEPRWHVKFKLLIREIILGHPDGPVSPQRWERWRKSPCQSEVAWLHRPWLALKGEGGKQSPRNTAAVTKEGSSVLLLLIDRSPPARDWLSALTSHV